MVECKGCKDPKVPEHDTLEGYCMLCAAKIIRESKTKSQRVKKLEAVAEEALALCKAEWKVRNNHPASNWAKEVEYFEQALKG